MESILLCINDNKISELIKEYLCSSYNLSDIKSDNDFKEKYDLIVTDLPFFNKSDHLIRLKKDNTAEFIPVLLVINKDDLYENAQGFQKIIDDILIIPFDFIELQMRVKMLIRARQFSLQVNKNVVLEANTKTNQIIESISDGFLIFDNNWICNYENCAAKRMLNQDLISKPAYEIYQEDSDIYQKILELEQHKRNGKNLEIYSKSMGRWFENRFYFYSEGISLLIKDITEDKLARQEIEKKNYLLSEAERLANLGSYDADHETGDVLWSDEMYHICGVDRENFKPDLYNFIDAIYPADREAFKNYINSSTAENLSNKIEIRVIQPNGTIRYTRGSGIAIKSDTKGKPVRIIGILQDITDDKIAEEDLSYKSYLMSESQRLAHLGNWVLDLHTTIEQWSDELYKIVEVSKENFIPTVEAIYNLIHQDDRILVKKWQKSLSAKISKSGAIYRLVLHNGKIKWINSVAESFGDDSGKPVKIIGFSQDITERKKVYDTIQLNEKRWRHFLEGFNGLAYQIDANTSEVTMLFGQVEAISGYSAQKFLSGEIQWDQFVYFEDLPGFSKENSRLINREINIANLDYRINHRDGSVHWFRDIGWIENIDSKAFISGITFDITNQKNLELRVKKLNRIYAVLSRINQAIVRTRNSEELYNIACKIAVNYGRFRKASIAIIRKNNELDIVAGCDSKKTGSYDIVNKTTIDSEPFYHGIYNNAPFIDNEFDSDKYNSKSLISSVAQDCKSIACFPLFVRNELKGVFFLCSCDSNFFDATEINLFKELCNDIGYAIEFIDNTLQVHISEEKLKESINELAAKNDELKKLNSELNSAVDELRQFDKAKTEFVSVASHEIRTPVATILGFAQTILASDIEISKEESCKYLRVIESEAIRLSKLVNEILDISKIQTGKLEITKEELDFVELIRNVIKTIKIPESLRMKFTVKKEIYSKIKGDRERLGQVIRNIVENAIRFSRPDTAISVSIRNVDGSILVAVKDTGPGISSADRKKIFDKFYKIRGERVKSSGSGLGLPIAKEIVNAHGGKIWVESKLGEGSTFIITIPLN